VRHGGVKVGGHETSLPDPAAVTRITLIPFVMRTDLV
jgi:hypothetical protein